ncbi:MAG: hypothetical protein P1P82_05045 [Bacteroidales bacterium]|nr:hypothetical protein [Bacteroidales bacterium]MDT8430805.1 hypothetical protein [Bacteroidales bacterium]
MKKVSLFLIAAVAATSVSLFTSCDGNEGNNGEEQVITGILVNENITENTTWETGNVYVLGGRIAVVDGVTLTIEPGVIVKGQAGTNVNATALLVARGATINAVGTADLPIIFTSVADEIEPEDLEAGNFTSPNLDPDINGLWGGVIVLGKAKISASNDNDEDISEIQIEGIPTSDPNGLYGGSLDTDNSGILKYISIRHGGANIGSGNEINGLSLGGVGSGTTIENIEVVANQDDGIEWFGGTVNVKNVVVWNVGDDGIDTDQSWAGTLDNFFVITPAGHAFELDGPEGSYEAGHTIKNGTVITSEFDEENELVRSTKDLINVDDNSIVALENIYFIGVIDGQKVNRVTAAGVSFTGITIDVPADSLSNHVNGDVPAEITAGGSPVATAAGLGWTWAAQAGKLQ